MTENHDSLHRLGDALEQAAAADLVTQRPATRRPRRTVLIAVAALMTVTGGAVAASRLVNGESVAKGLSGGTVALLDSTATCTEVTGPDALALPKTRNDDGAAVGGEVPSEAPPDATPAEKAEAAARREKAAKDAAAGRARLSRVLASPMAGPVFDCVLDPAPAPEVDDWTGTVEPTIDATGHIDGGCRGLNAEGTKWRCYVGEDAVRQQIIGLGLLGVASGPGQG